jgi:hypothetical protein
MRSVRWLCGLFAVVAAACGDQFQTSGGGSTGTTTSIPPADVAGDYNVAVTNGDNGCEQANWMKGASTTDIAFTITQKDAAIVGTVGGLAGAYMDLVLGSHEFTGEVTESAFTMTNYGTQQGKKDGCSYTYNAVIEGTINGDAVQGKIHYEPKTNGSPDCGVLNDCTSEQSFSGVRPPN